MKNLWNDAEAAALSTAPDSSDLALRVYSSQLLGREPALVLHGGGNTSVKSQVNTFFGDREDIIYIKGSGWDLATIQPAGFAPTRLAPLLRLAELPTLSDVEMVRQLRAAMIDPDAPTPSIEAILHAALPAKYVDHTHANAIVALTNNPEGEAWVKKIFGSRVLIVPYIMPGFILARTVAQMIRGVDLSQIEGIVLMQHGLFTWGQSAKESYDRMIQLVTEAEAAVGNFAAAEADAQEDLLALAQLRRAVSQTAGQPLLARLDASRPSVGFSQLEKIDSLATQGPLTPDHSIRTKRIPLVWSSDRHTAAEAVAEYAEQYRAYFHQYEKGHTLLPPAPNFVVWPRHGLVSFGPTVKDADIVRDIAQHTAQTIQRAEALGGWRALPASDIFEIEYWELEQAKLRKNAGSSAPLRGKVALVTGAAAGIGQRCAEVLLEQGACVVGLDLNPEITTILSGPQALGLVVNLTDQDAVKAAIEETVRRFGGLDIVVSNAGIFTAGSYLEELDDANWSKSLLLNLTCHQQLLKHCIPYLKHGIDATAIIVGSRNVRAPGAGAASYSCAKAGLTQLVRVAALELAPHHVRVNIIHPDAVFDTKLWTPEALQRSAERYGLTVDEYKKRNLMKCEITSRDIGLTIAAMAGSAFFKTTGAQIPVDGGNDRTI
jgi:rhamnose utilization protein RhaD (predicted bifunctional aldolase and dehydrogenase)/NAD(P)-dependent dehydrogenase (short-subunit alcohol dehydrogenase family)